MAKQVPRRAKTPVSYTPVVTLPGVSDRFFALSLDPLYVAGLDGYFRAVNPAFEQTLGYTIDELLKAPIASFAHPDDAIVTEQLWASLADGKATPFFQNRCRRKDGTYRWLSWRSSAPDEQGLVYGVARDVTDLRSRDERARFQAQLLDAVGQAVIATDLTGRITYWNRGAERLLGWPAVEALGQAINDITPAEASKEQAEAILRELAQGRSWSGEFPLRRRDGTVFPALVSDTPVFDALGKLCGIVGVSVDLTEQKRTESALRQQALIVETISDAVIVMDADANVTDWNPAAERIFGYTKSEMLGCALRILNAPEAGEDLDRQIREAYLRDGRWSGEIPFVRKDGTRGVVDAIVAVQMDAANTVTSVVSVSRDVTERRRLEAQLQQAQKMEAVGRLAGGIAHDFNNMLTAVKGYSEFLLEDLDATDARRTDVQEIRKAADRAAALTRQLLAFSRKQVLQPRPLDLNEVVEGMEKMLRRLIGEDVQIVTRLKPGLRLVEADPGQIEQVIMNLAVNARDAMPEGGKITIVTDETVLSPETAADGVARVAEPRPFATLSIIDTGVGMDAGTRAHIFEPFFTTKPVGQGTGLGLSTVYGIVTQSGGHITVETAAGDGSTFTVFLPQIAGNAHPAAGPTTSRLPRGTETLLLVDDDEGVRAVARRILQRAGYTVISAADAVEAMRLIGEAAGAVDLLITDVVMPGLGGRDLVTHVRDSYPDLRVLFVSGYTEEAVRRHGVLDAGSAFLEKPFTTERLALKVREVLDAARGGHR